MHFHTQKQTRTTRGGLLSPNTRTTRSGHHHHGHGLGLGSATGATTTTRRSPGTGLFSRRAGAPRSAHRKTRTTRRTRTTGGGLFGNSHRRAKKSSALPVGITAHRKPTMGDRISGAFLKLKGSITGRPREKAIGDRRMHGTSRNRLRRQPGQHIY